MMPSEYHIRACCGEIPGTMKMERNAFGNVTSMVGISVEMLNWMSRALHIPYQCENVPPITTVENTSKSVGIIHYLTHDVCDVGVGPVVIRYDRYQLTDFIYPWVTEPVRLLIPMPVFVSDSSAFFEPFSSTVWMIIVCFILAMISMLTLLDHIKVPTAIRGVYQKKFNLHWLFVTGSLLGQGGFNASQKIPIRILMAVWILASFLIIQMYNSQFYGYLMTKTPLPVVTSVEELADKSGVDLVVVNAWAPDLIITKSDFPLMKKLARKLNESPVPSRCTSPPDCIKMVKKNKRPTAFLHQMGPINVGMMDDFARTGQCNFALAPKSFDNYQQSWLIRKGDQHIEFYNRATMRMHEAGLLNHWLDTYQPKPLNCLEMAKPKEDPRNPDQISLKNFGVLFVMLLSGFILSFTTFIFEKWLAACRDTRNCRIATAAV